MEAALPGTPHLPHSCTLLTSRDTVNRFVRVFPFSVDRLAEFGERVYEEFSIFGWPSAGGKVRAFSSWAGRLARVVRRYFGGRGVWVKADSRKSADFLRVASSEAAERFSVPRPSHAVL